MFSEMHTLRKITGNCKGEFLICLDGNVGI